MGVAGGWPLYSAEVKKWVWQIIMGMEKESSSILGCDTVIEIVVPLASSWRHTQFEPLKHATTYPMTECNILEAVNLQQHHCKNPETHNSVILTAGCESVQLWQLCGSAANCWSAEHLCEWSDNEKPTGRLPIQQHSVQVSRQQRQKVFLALVMKTCKNA